MLHRDMDQTIYGVYHELFSITSSEVGLVTFWPLSTVYSFKLHAPK